MDGLGLTVIMPAMALPLHAFKRYEHVQLARALFPQSDERLVLGIVVPSLEGIHVGELDDDYSLGRPVAALR